MGPPPKRTDPPDDGKRVCHFNVPRTVSKKATPPACAVAPKTVYPAATPPASASGAKTVTLSPSDVVFQRRRPSIASIAYIRPDGEPVKTTPSAIAPT